VYGYVEAQKSRQESLVVTAAAVQNSCDPHAQRKHASYLSTGAGPLVYVLMNLIRSLCC